MATGFHAAFCSVTGLRVANFSPSSTPCWKMYIYIYAPVTSWQGYSGTFLLGTTLKITWHLQLLLTALEMCSYNRQEQLQEGFASHSVLNSVCFCFLVCFDQQKSSVRENLVPPCWSLPRCYAQRRGFPEVALLVSWDHRLQLTLSYLLLKENPKMYCIM